MDETIADALNDLQTLQNELVGRWTAIPEIGNYIVKPPDSQVEEWIGLIENIRQALLSNLPPPPAATTAKKEKAA